MKVITQVNARPLGPLESPLQRRRNKRVSQSLRSTIEKPIRLAPVVKRHRHRNTLRVGVGEPIVHNNSKREYLRAIMAAVAKKAPR